MTAYTKVTRDQIASYLKTGETGTSTVTPTWSLIGVGVTDYGMSFNPQVETEKWIINKNATSSLESFQIQGDVSQKCYKGDAVYDYVNNLRRTAAVGSAVESEILDIDLYDSTTESSTTTYKATKYACSVVITSYATGENPVIEYSIYYNGDPVLGTCTFTNGVPTFTEAS